MIYILITILILNVLIIIFMFFKKTKLTTSDLDDKINAIEKNQERFEKVLKEEMSVSRKESADNEKRIREEINNLFKSFGDTTDKKMANFSEVQGKNFDNFSKRLAELTDKNSQMMEKIRTTIENKLELIQKDNSDKLEKMRATVDEKLHATLEKRLGESFKIVSDRLELVHKGLGEMQTLALGVGDLKKVLTNVKTRGTWGEVQLGNLLEQILTPEQYGKNVAVKGGTSERVEFAIKLPSKDNDSSIIWLPIDAKFPLEDYQRLVEAQEKEDITTIEQMSKALEARIKQEAKNIRNKYIDPPKTTDFCILYLPIEGLFAEVLRRPGLWDWMQKECKVIVAGPTTISAILNSLQMGFRTLAIEKRSSEVWNILGSIKTEFSKFGDLLDKTKDKLQQASNTIEDAAAKSRTIERKLNKVQGLPQPETAPLIEVPKEVIEQKHLTE